MMVSDTSSNPMKPAPTSSIGPPQEDPMSWYDSSDTRFATSKEPSSTQAEQRIHSRDGTSLFEAAPGLLESLTSVVGGGIASVVDKSKNASFVVNGRAIPIAAKWLAGFMPSSGGSGVDEKTSKLCSPPVADALHRIFQRFKLQLFEIVLSFRQGDAAKTLDEIAAANRLDELAQCYRAVWQRAPAELFDERNWTQETQLKWVQRVYEIELGPVCQDTQAQTLHLALSLFDQCSREFRDGIAPVFRLESREEPWKLNARRIARDLIICRRFTTRVPSDFTFSSSVFRSEPFLKRLAASELPNDPEGSAISSASLISLRLTKSSNPSLDKPDHLQGAIIKGRDVLTRLADGGADFNFADDESAEIDVCPPSDDDDPQTFLDLSPAVASTPAREALMTRCKQQAREALEMKQNPVILYNVSDKEVKACFYKATDMFCVLPLGGVNGYGVNVLKPGQTVHVPLPACATDTSDGAVIVKVFEPRIIDKVLYKIKIVRGQTIELHSNEASVRSTNFSSQAREFERRAVLAE